MVPATTNINEYSLYYMILACVDFKVFPHDIILYDLKLLSYLNLPICRNIINFVYTFKIMLGITQTINLGVTYLYYVRFTWLLFMHDNALT